MDEKRLHNKRDEHDDAIPNGIYEDVGTINNFIEEVAKLKAAKNFELAAEKAKVMLEKKVLPPMIKQQVILESVDIYLEISQYTEAQDLLRFVKTMNSVTGEVAKQIDYRILYIGIVKELLRKNNKEEVPWSSIPRLIMHQADQEMEKLIPGYLEKTSGKKDLVEQTSTIKADGLKRNQEIIAADKNSEKKDRFWIIVLVTVLLAVGVGFMLAMYYLSLTSDDTNATMNTNVSSIEKSIGQATEEEGNSIVVGNDTAEAEAIDDEMLTAEVYYSPGEWYFIQAGAYSNIELATLNNEKFIKAGFYAEKISEDPTLLMLFAGTSQAQSESKQKLIQNHPDFKDFSMYVRTIQSKSESMQLKGRSIDAEAIGLFGERMTGYLRLVSDTSLYLLEETEQDKQAEATRELLNTANQIRQQFETILAIEENQQYQTLQMWQEELSYITEHSQSSIETQGFHLRLQEHLFRLLVPQIW